MGRRYLLPQVARWTGWAGLLFGGAVCAQSTVTSVEYVHAQTGQYYRTDVASEIAALDQNAAASGWARTGQTLTFWRAATDAPAGAVPVSKTVSLNLTTPSSPQWCTGSKMGTLGGGNASPCTPIVSMAYALLPDANGNCASGTQPVYRSSRIAAPANVRLAHALYVYQDMFDRGWQGDGVVLCAPGASTAQDADIYRLLKQASFGASDALFNQVKQQGITAWVDGQLNMPAQSSMPALAFFPTQKPTSCTSDGVAGSAATICDRDNYTLFQLQLAFVQNALNKPDQLRQRVAFALSQILVTSGVDASIMPYGMAKYQQLFLDYAFGNYKDLLIAVTLSPAMGDYLNMANSNKPDAARGIAANENYAREIMQLFSIGLFELNPDGTYKKDTAGNLIPTYTQTTVENLARVFTGWTYTNQGGGAPTRNNPPYYEFPMMPVESNHDTTSKTLLNGFVVPAGQTATVDLFMAIDHLFSHPNVAPFIGKQLIQKLVTGDPSPAYVARVAAVFNDNGSGVKGDLKAVVRAILLDPEARGPIKTLPGFGKLKEPLLFAIAAYRGLGGVNDGLPIFTAGIGHTTTVATMGQDIFRAPTVFNFYPPDNTISTGRLGPEFDILTSSTAFARANFLNEIVYLNYPVNATVTGSTGTTIDWSGLQALAGNTATLIDKLAWTFTAGTLSDSARQQITTAVNALATTDTQGRARAAAYLVLNSSQFQVDR